MITIASISNLHARIRAGIKQVKPPLVAYLAYLVNQIASVGPRKRGRKAYEVVRGDLSDHTYVNKGIERALKFMKNKKKCPTRSLLVGKIQKKK